jgi:Cdc6-like AAA superfamily ATPase
MFKQIGVDPRETKQVLYKLLQANSKLDHSYLKLIVIGNPLDKKHLNTDIKMTTSELMIVFDPKIITIATEFVDLNLSQENKEAAIEKFGEIKEKTEAAVTETIDKPVKAQIGADIVFNSITVAIPFSPQRQNSDCWGLNLGVTHLTTD